MRLWNKDQKCFACGEPIPDGKRSDKKWCSTKCGNNFRNRKAYKNNPEKYKELRLKENSNVQRRIFSRTKSRAKINEIEFNIDIDDIIIPEVCPVLNIEIKQEYGKGTNPIHSPSIDRINPKLGYTKGNVRIISNRANLLKSNATVEELELVLKDLKEVTCA